MTIFHAIVAIAAAQAAPAPSADHSNHNNAQHAQHQQGQHAEHGGMHKCCTEVNGKMECKMMKGHKAEHQGDQKGHQGHGSSD